MGLFRIGPGNHCPEEFNVAIEIPANASPIKYEVDKETGALVVDRFMSTPMFYPCNYGYVPQTLSEDGDPVDVLVVTPYPLHNGVVIACRAVGVLMMTDEAGEDSKILAVPIDKLTPFYHDVKTYKDLPQPLLDSVIHFFEHYKDLEPNKWVKVNGWKGVGDAKKELADSVKRYNA